MKETQRYWLRVAFLFNLVSPDGIGAVVRIWIPVIFSHSAACCLIPCKTVDPQ